MNLDILFWLFLAAYAIHLVDETAVNGGFVHWIKSSFWPKYTGKMFFWFNFGAVVAIALSNILYDAAGGHWIILALVWPFGFALHGFTVHLFWTIKQKNPTPGLITSVIYWIIAWLIVRYGFLAGSSSHIARIDFWTGLIVGAVVVGGFLTFAPTVVMPALLRKRRRRR